MGARLAGAAANEKSEANEKPRERALSETYLEGLETGHGGARATWCKVRRGAQWCAEDERDWDSASGGSGFASYAASR